MIQLQYAFQEYSFLNKINYFRNIKIKRKLKTKQYFFKEKMIFVIF